VFKIVAAPDHPLAGIGGRVARSELARRLQIVLADRTDLSRDREFGVFSPQTWRLTDVFAKHSFLVSGLGWGGMPAHVVEKDIEEGRLVELTIEDAPDWKPARPMFITYCSDDPPGPAGRWFIEQLKTATAESKRSADG
jgi:DNA-binding transcriptional LysR family regulator